MGDTFLNSMKFIASVSINIMKFLVSVSAIVLIITIAIHSPYDWNEKKLYRIELMNGKIIEDSLYLDIGGYRNDKRFYPDNAIISVEEINP